MSGSLQVRGDLGKWAANTANNSLAVNQSLLSFSVFAQFISFAGTGNTPFFATTNNNGFSIQGDGFGHLATFLGGVNTFANYGIPTAFGLTYHIAGTLNATGTTRIYVNGLVVATAANVGNTNNVACGIVVGWPSAVSANFLISDAAIWSGTELSAADIINLRNRSVTPVTASTPATSWWTLGGTAATNPVASAAGLLDQIGANHFTTLPGAGGVSTNAVYSATSLSYVSPVTVTAAYVARGGMFVFSLGTNPVSGTVLPVCPTTVNGDPTIKVNGVTAQLQGPFWSSVTNIDPWVAYQIVGGVLSTDVVTWSTPDAWVLTPIGGATTDSGTAANYLGAYEPGLYGYLPMDPSLVTKTLRNGWNGPAIVTSECSTIKNVVHRISNGITGGGSAWNNLTSFDPTTGYPTGISGSFAGVSTGPFWVTNDNNGINPLSGFPLPEGTWTIVGDETAPATPMIVGMNCSSAMDISGPTITPGVLTGGVEVGRRFDFNLTYHAHPPTSLNVSLSLSIQRPVPHAAGLNTLHNIKAFEAGNTPTANPENVLNDNFVRMLTASPGICVPIMRFMEALTGSDGAGNQVYGSDYPPNNLFGYSGTQYAPWTGAGNWPTNNPTLADNRQIPIYAIRKYDTTAGHSPFVYADQHYARTVASNITNYPWMWDLNALGLGYDWGFPNDATALRTPNVIVEYVVADNAGNPIAHNLKTGQLIQPPTFPTAVNVTNANAPGGGPYVAQGLSAYNAVIVTGASTFVIIVSSNLPQPWPLSLGFVTGGPYLQQTGGVNPIATYTSTQGNAPRIEDIGCVATALNKCALWIAVPHCINDDGVTTLATRLFNSTPRGTPIYVEFSNEIFIGNWQYWWMNQIAAIENLGATVTANFGSAIMQRTAEVHAIFTTVWGADSGSIVRVFQPFINTPGPTNDAMKYAHANSIPIDAIATAIYMDMDTSPTFAMAAAAICVGETISISGTPTKVSIANTANSGGAASVLRLAVANTALPMAAYQDLCRHHIRYNKNYNGPNGFLPVFIQALKNSGYGQGGGSSGYVHAFPKIVGYECAWSAAIPPGPSTQLAVVRAGLSHDFMYHPSMYDTSTAFLEHMQQPGPAGTLGFDTICIESLTGTRNSGPGNATTADGSSSDGHFVELWGSCNWQGQQIGVAPFTGQQYWSSDLGGDAGVHDFENHSINGRAYLDWITSQAGGLPTSSATMGITERHDAGSIRGLTPVTSTMGVVGRNDSIVALSGAAVAASITKVSPSRIPINTLGSAIVDDQSITLLLAGAGTNWTNGSTVTITNSVTGATTVVKGTWTRLTATSATLVVSTGLGAGTWHVTIDGVVSRSLVVGAKHKGWYGQFRMRHR
jgi:hypothetical protein